MSKKLQMHKCRECRYIDLDIPLCYKKNKSASQRDMDTLHRCKVGEKKV